MRKLELFKPGEVLTAKKLNYLVEQLRIIQNIQADRQSDILVTYTKNGLLIGRQVLPLMVDDKYLLDASYNISTRVQRRCDLKKADIGDFFRMRAIPDAEERPQGISKTLPLIHLMQFLNTVDGGEGGWITDAGLGFQYVEKTDKHGIAPPINHVAQWGSVIVLTDDDVSKQTSDGDGFTYVNIRHDAHQHMDEEHDGRIYFTRNPPGSEPTGFEIMGEMICDPAKANDPLSELERESGEWSCQLKIPALDVPGEIYTPRDATSYGFPPLVRIPNSSLMAYEFGNIGRDEGWSAHYQPQHRLQKYGLGFMIKYTAENVTELQQNAYIGLDWKIANDGGDVSTAGMTSSDFSLPVPSGSTEQILRHAFVGFINPTQYIDKSLIIVDHFAREAGNVLDTLASRLLAVEVEMIFMVVIVPP